MAAPNLRSAWFRPAAAIAMAGALAFGAAAGAPLQAYAGERPAASAANWTPELRELRRASDAAREYAENNYGIGIVLHVGRDLSGRPDADAAIQKVASHFVQKFAARDVEARVFLAMNGDARSTGVTYHIDKLIHGAHNGTEVKGLRTALQSIPNVIDQLRVAKSIAAAVGDARPTAPGG